MKKNRILCALGNSILPVRRGTILFESFAGQYSDSPKAISEYIHDKYPEIKLIWIKSEARKDSFPEYVEVIESKSKKYYEYEWRANVIIDNISSIRSEWIHTGDGLLKKIVIKYFTRKRKNQLSISTWHGVPLKRIGMDNISFEKDCYLSTNCNYVLAGNMHSKKCLESSLGNAIPVVASGIPRNDALIRSKADCIAIKRKLGIPENKNVILYAPTFRQNVFSSGVDQMKSIDFPSLLSSLKKRFGGEWCFVFRTHMNVTKEIKNSGIIDSLGDYIIDGNTHDDMLDYLKCADVLLTDYSSCMFDYIFTERPCFLYTPDLFDYEKKERGFYIDFSKLPFDSSGSLQGLYDNIEKFDYDKYRERCESFLAFLENVDDGKATERIAEEIIEIIKRKKDIKNFMRDFR